VYRRVAYRLDGWLALLTLEGVIVGNSHAFELTRVNGGFEFFAKRRSSAEALMPPNYCSAGLPN
jgi:hypothetical protein